MENISLGDFKSKFRTNKKFKIITLVIGGLIVTSITYFLYKQFIFLPKNEKSKESYVRPLNDINNASKQTNKDIKLKEINKAIKLLESSVKLYDGYIGGEISQYLLGRQYMEKKEFQKAIKNLEGVDVNDTYIRIYSIGLQGDCYSELKKYDRAIEKYLEAADLEDNEFTTPMYLLKAGLCAEKRKDYEAATTYYTRILDDYPAYGSQKTIEKYIARTSTIKKK